MTRDEFSKLAGDNKLIIELSSGLVVEVTVADNILLTRVVIPVSKSLVWDEGMEVE